MNKKDKKTAKAWFEHELKTGIVRLNNFKKLDKKEKITLIEYVDRFTM